LITAADVFTAIDDPDLPSLRVPDLKVEKVAQGFSAPTSMAFVDERNLIVLQKNDGHVRLISNGTLASEPLATFTVENASERGLLGVATNGRDVFVYVTESSEQGEVRHRVYRFSWYSGSLADKTMILDLPGTPGPNHDGGKMVLGPDGMLYIVIGDLNRNGVLQNFQGGPPPDDTSVILKVDRDGRPAANVLAGLPLYYAYGIRNSFGLAFDPATGTLWDTENGPEGYDEINVVRPGFNSGWERVMGPMARTQSTEADLVQLEGSHYADPAASLRDAVGITDLAFAGGGLGSYAGGIFVGDINGGTLYYFRVNAERDGLVLEGEGLADGVVDGGGEAGAVTMGAGFGGITDIESGPDGNLYVLSYEGDIYRIRAVQ
jgi:glucose/arabinose dehydrogenase